MDNTRPHPGVFPHSARGSHELHTAEGLLHSDSNKNITGNNVRHLSMLLFNMRTLNPRH